LNKAIVIATTNGREEWLKDCLESLKDYKTHPIIVLNQYEWEIGKIKWIYDHTDLDEFIFLQDSVIIKDISWIDVVFNLTGHSVSLCEPPFTMYMGKFTREGLSKLEMPLIRTKKEAVFYEANWCSEYARLNDYSVLWTDLVDNPSREFHHGRENMVLENPYIKKYKGTWDLSQIPEE
jgi:hypothetical protein